MDMKKCTKCNEERPIQDFYKHGDTIRPDCKFCSRHRVREYSQKESYKEAAKNRTKEWIKNNRDKARETARNWRNTTYRGYFNKKLTTTRSNSKKKGVECSIGAEYLEKLYHEQNGLCVISGRKLIIGPSSLEKDALSLDRIDCTKGYVEGNIRLVTYQVNTARGIWGDEALITLCEDIIKRRV